MIGVLLRWKEWLRLQTAQFARDRIRAQPRHLRLDYIFWEYLENGSAAPLFGYSVVRARRWR